ncbi:Uncharacterized protein HSRCO_0050 [Halanaeroarchaeum sp. HSR-CO]|uniref:DUF7260 family protein n=1 Tax=Halanaeroarchaeum sp. HSR-CO TaxID=2866382 RepID=UPI00217DE005|nr:hypothetical protein [Halanaeroarchaeum sp. HSR-CO]UWG46352.1 Uncharacterized protein HSRCO_0050 [Halanaeroarchaeum sp. HSR-CO]
MSLVEAIENGRLGSAFEELQHTVRVEQKRTTAERQAFEAFGRRVRRLAGAVEQPTSSTVVGDGGTSVSAAIDPFQTERRATSNTVADVRTAYEETVMSVAHYDAEYDDTYATSVHAEFGREIGAALTRPGWFSTVTVQALVGKIEQAIAEREPLETALDREYRSLETTSDNLRDIEDERRTIASIDFEDERFGALDAYRVRIELLSEKSERIIDSRQSTIHDHSDVYSIGDTPDGFFEYLYESYEPRYPVLYLGTDVGRKLESTADRILDAIVQNW